MKKMIVFCVCLVSIAILSGCDYVQKKGEIVEIYLHEAGHYSLLARDGNEGSELITIDFGYHTPRIFTDVPKGGTNWYTATCLSNAPPNATYTDGMLHIKSSKDITASKGKKKDGDKEESEETVKLLGDML